MKNKTNKAIMLCLTALFTALIAVGAYIKIPAFPVPITLQTFFVILSGILLGKNYGSLSVIVYIFLGLLGLPVFSSGGGIHYVLNPSFGYITGFVLCSFIVGYLVHKKENPSFKRIFLSSVTGVFLIYLVGMIYYVIILNLFTDNSDLSFKTIIVSGFLIFIPLDVVICIIASLISKRLIPYTKKYRKKPDR